MRSFRSFLGETKNQYRSPLEKIKAGLVRQPNGCLFWMGTKDNDGYGRIVIGGERVPIHRVVLENKIGRKIREGYQSLHTCHTPSCVEEEHLYEGTQADNNRDTVQEGRHVGWGDFHAAKTHCPQGHPYSEINTYHYRSERHCKQCKKERKQAKKGRN